MNTMNLIRRDGTTRKVHHTRMRWLLQGCLVVAMTALLVLIPGNTVTALAGEDTIHVVQPGETLSAIAARYGVSVYTLTRYNGISNANYLRVGQVLTIPSATVAPVRPTPVVYPTPVPTERFVTPRSNDRVVPTPVIIDDPTPTPTTIVPTPVPPTPSLRVHVVSANETLTSIAYLYGTTPSALKARNGLTSDRIYRGQRLIIP